MQKVCKSVNERAGGWGGYGERGHLKYCCHKGSLIVMFIHANGGQNTSGALLCVKRIPCITGEAAGPVCGCIGKPGATEPISVPAAQERSSAAFTQMASAALGECCKDGKLLRGPH